MIESARGYEEEAPDLLKRYEEFSFDEAHPGLAFDLIPPPGARVLDIGAGTGRDAAWFAARGDDVTAIEPTRAMREGAIKLHPALNITWIDDSLPELSSVRGRRFDLVWMSAVWMHFDEPTRARMMSVVAALMAPAAKLMISLRHGPIPAGRCMYDVSAAETEALARASGLACLSVDRARAGRAAGVVWDRLWFQRP